MTRLQAAVGTLVLERRLRGLAGGVLALGRRLGIDLLDRFRQESKALSLAQDPEDLGGFLFDNLDGADVLGPQRNVDEPVSRSQVEERTPVRQKPVPDRYARQNDPHAPLNQRLQDWKAIGQVGHPGSMLLG